MENLRQETKRDRKIVSKMKGQIGVIGRIFENGFL
jgi:hypothetical protein